MNVSDTENKNGVAILYPLGYGTIVHRGTALVPLWMIMIGIAGGAAFGLSMMFFTLLTRSPHEAPDLSGMAQSFGYLHADIGPVFFEFLHDLTSSWTFPMLIITIASGMSSYLA